VGRRKLPPPRNSATAHAIHVPGSSRMFRFVVPGTFCSNLSSERWDMNLEHRAQDRLQMARVKAGSGKALGWKCTEQNSRRYVRRSCRRICPRPI